MSAGTKEQILDAAETLMVERGIDAVSLRAITAAANVNLAAVHYHFGSKEALVETIFARRVGPLNRRRLELLDEIEARAGDGPLPLEEVLRALMAPALHIYRDHERGRLFMRLCGRIYAEPAEFLEKLFEDLFQELVQRFTVAFSRALPEASDVDRAWAMHFSIGAMIHTMLESEKLKRFSSGLCDPSDTEAVLERMVRFCAAGLRASVRAGNVSETTGVGQV